MSVLRLKVCARLPEVSKLDIVPLSFCPSSVEYFADVNGSIFYDALMTIFQVLGKHSIDFLKLQ